MDESRSNNNIVREVPTQKCCTKKRFMIPALIIRAISVILCIIQFSFQATNVESYKEFQSLYKDKDLNDMPNYSSSYFKQKLELKEKENGNAIFNLIPSLVSLIFGIFLFLHFWFEEKCCYGNKSHVCAQNHIVFCIMITFMLSTINIISSLIDYDYRTEIMAINFIDPDYQQRNNVNKTIDLFLFSIAIITYIFLIIIGCLVSRENKMCQKGIECCCCRINICDMCNCCCDNPPLSNASTNSLNNQASSREQQQNVLVVRKNAETIPQNNNSNIGDSVSNGNNNLYNNHDNKLPQFIQIPNSKETIETGIKKVKGSKKKKNSKK